jgi:hypothetical protein
MAAHSENKYYYLILIIVVSIYFVQIGILNYYKID